MTHRDFLEATSGALGVWAVAESGSGAVANESGSASGGGGQEFLIIDSRVHLPACHGERLGDELSPEDHSFVMAATHPP